jgi:uncharacterized damage-inducible protein DinB
MENQNQTAVKVTYDLFKRQLDSSNKLIDSLTDEQLEQEIAPGRNTGIYLLGHLTAVHDAMIPLLGFGETLHPELLEPFIKNPDKSGFPKPAIQDVRAQWHKVNTTLTSKLDALSTDEWFGKHTSVSEEDFQKEPHRNRLSVIMGRTSHMTYHIGQMALLKNR